MKKYIILCGVAAMLATIACNNTSNENTQAPAEKTAPAETTRQDGTTIKVNDEGIVIENKDGSKKNNVSISKDSASIEISKPK